MEMPTASRAALIRRVSAVLGADRPAPKTWAELNTTEQFMLQEADPQAAQILKGQMSAELELQLISGQLSDTAPAVITPEQQRAQAIADWCEAHPVLDPFEAAAATNRQVLEQQRAVEMERQASAEIASRAMKAQNASARGW